MKNLGPFVLSCCLCCSSVARGDGPLRVDDPWTLWTANTTKLWGANIYQEVDVKSWGPWLRRHDFQDLRRAGANYVNLSVPGPYDPSGDFNPDSWQRLKDCVEWAKAADLKVVIGFRTAPGRNEADITSAFEPAVVRDLLDNPASPNVAKFCDMWAKVAKEYGQDPAVVGFDLLVEPHAPKPWAKDEFNDYQYRASQSWPIVAAQAIQAIRAQKVDTPILVEPDLWAAAAYLNHTDETKQGSPILPWIMPDNDDRLVCAVHQYGPSDYTETGCQPFDIDFTELKSAFSEISTWQAQYNKVPLCVNEFGVTQTRPYAELFLRKELALLKTAGVGHAVWLWEVSDPQVDYHDFDVRYNPAVYSELRANWQSNADDQRASGPNAAKPENRSPLNMKREWPGQRKHRLPHTSLHKPAAHVEPHPRTAACDCDTTVYDPELKLTLQLQDARAEFLHLSDESPLDRQTQQTVSAQRKARRSRTASKPRAWAPQPLADGPSRAIGFWLKDDQLTFHQSTAIRYKIIFPDAPGGDFQTHIYQTSTNHSRKGTEAHIAFRNVPGESAWFWIFDWSVCNGVLIRHVPVTKMAKWVNPVVAGGKKHNEVLVVNQTRLLQDTTWSNCVYLGVFEKGQLQRFDVVYSNTYKLNSNNDQKATLDDGFWGPEIETFQCYAKPLHPMGFSGCWMIQDGQAIVLDDSNCDLHNDGFGLHFNDQVPRPYDFLVH